MTTQTWGPTLVFSERLHAEKYRQEAETFTEAVERFCGALSDNTAHYQEAVDICGPMRFLPAGRVQAAMGSAREVTPYNCYVSGTIADSFTSGEGCITQRVHEAAQTMRLGGGIGYGFSTLRPRGSLIKKLMSTSCGPVPFMDIFNSTCGTVSSAGHRRGAQMGVLRIDHPDIEEFIEVKQDLSKLTNFNLSVAVTDKFMKALRDGNESFDLVFEGKVYKTVNPAELWDKLMRTTWDYAEPGVLFIDTINRMNNLWYCEVIEATNPCGEQPLPPFGACLLGSFNLVKYIYKNLWGLQFNYDLFAADIAPIVRMMDNVVDRAMYPLPQQEEEAKNKRRMGLGVTALANAAEALGLPYGSHAFLAFEAQVLSILRNETYRASVQLAKEKGVFPLFDVDKYMQGEFIKTLPADIQAGIREHGIRNSHLTSIAPTGTISFTADYISSSIEPVFSYEGKREVNMPEGKIIVDVADYGYRVFGVEGRLADEVTAKEHVDVLAVASRYVDSAVSKTINMDGNTMSYEDFKQIYVRAWESGCKGCTTFNKSGKRMGILLGLDEPVATVLKAHKAEAKVSKTVESCEWDPETGRKSCE